MKAIILFSGGLDSTTCLYYALSKKYECYCLLFDYGQRHKKELKQAVKIAKLVKARYKIVSLNLPSNSDALTDKTQKIPVFKANRKKIPPTYVPGRNTIFLSIALSYAESIKADAIFIGANAIDFSGYPDCRPEFIAAFNALIKALKLKIKILSPLLRLSKSEIIKLGIKLKVPYELTWSCYSGLDKPCGVCDSCKLRQKGFEEAGIKTIKKE